MNVHTQWMYFLGCLMYNFTCSASGKQTASTGTPIFCRKLANRSISCVGKWMKKQKLIIIEWTQYWQIIITGNSNLSITLAGINLSVSEYRNICGVKFSKRIKLLYGFMLNAGCDVNKPFIRRKISCSRRQN